MRSCTIIEVSSVNLASPGRRVDTKVWDYQGLNQNLNTRNATIPELAKDAAVGVVGKVEMSLRHTFLV